MRERERELSKQASELASCRKKIKNLLFSLTGFFSLPPRIKSLSQHAKAAKAGKADEAGEALKAKAPKVSG